MSANRSDYDRQAEVAVEEGLEKTYCGYEYGRCQPVVSRSLSVMSRGGRLLASSD